MALDSMEGNFRSQSDMNSLISRGQVVQKSVDSLKGSNYFNKSTHSAQDKRNSSPNDIPQKAEFIPEEWPVFANRVHMIQEILKDIYSNHKRDLSITFRIVCLLAYLGYFSFAMYWRFGNMDNGDDKNDEDDQVDEGSIRLIVLTSMILSILAVYIFYDILDNFRKALINIFPYLTGKEARNITRWLLYAISTAVTCSLITVLVALDTPGNLWSLVGLAAIVVVCFLTSHNPAMVNWHTLFWGFSLQFYFAVFILKTSPGLAVFQWLGDRVLSVLSVSDVGAKFVFGDFAEINLEDGSTLKVKSAYLIHLFAFKILPTVVFFNTIISILYYLGVMQAIIQVIGRFLAYCLGTTAAESISAAGNIFVSMAESPLLIGPFLPKMTSSELHAVMCGGFATIAGGVLGIYISIGVPANHLLAASVMSAPASLAISKLTYPEDEIPVIKDDYSKEVIVTETNVLEAACSGATKSSVIVASIAVNVIAFLSILELFNNSLAWFGERVGVKDLSFEFLCSYLLYPVALAIGTEEKDCGKLAELIGLKTFTNEFIAYSKLLVYQKNRQKLDNYTATFGTEFHYHNEDIHLDKVNETLNGGVLSLRSEEIATYALCGFSNFGSVGILLGSMTSMAPNREATLSRIILRAMIFGNVACFFTACVAGLFFEPEE